MWDNSRGGVRGENCTKSGIERHNRKIRKKGSTVQANQGGLDLRIQRFLTIVCPSAGNGGA